MGCGSVNRKEYVNSYGAENRNQVPRSFQHLFKTTYSIPSYITIIPLRVRVHYALLVTTSPSHYSYWCFKFNLCCVMSVLSPRTSAAWWREGEPSISQLDARSEREASYLMLISKKRAKLIFAQCDSLFPVLLEFPSCLSC